ncbi:hypothetical protein [Nocardioides sp. 616]|uniref:hypothetical protein n=1 Tax=Nocardioides sp. 616 TaxID=2268090 RepID=UPI0013B3CD06|nr:hypothetical protein [Nocardioides sp. 616]
MDPDQWGATCRPARVVHPVRLDPDGLTGPTRGQARSVTWRRSSRGLYVPSGVPLTPEQRAAEVAAALPTGGQLTGWAALRLAGAGYFDGLAGDGLTRLPVPVRIPHETRREIPGARVIRTTAPRPAVLRQSLPCADPETAVLDQMQLAGTGRAAVVVMDMAALARLTSVRRVRERLAADVRRRGTRRLRWALDHACERSRSPRETLMRLVWELDAGFDRPLVTAEVVDLAGRFVGIADLLDPLSGVAGEYDGANHRTRARHRSDEERRERFQAVGLERFTVVAGDSVSTQVARMTAARSRARWLPPGQRRWRVA